MVSILLVSDNETSFTNQQFHQTIHHSGVGAHHSNGIAEWNIHTVTSTARAMMHHMAIHWPEVADVTLWPLAILYAVYILNRIPWENYGRSPLKLFNRKTRPVSKFLDFHTEEVPLRAMYLGSFKFSHHCDGMARTKSDPS